ncbi:MAG: ANTAR domain-containing protein [Gammaproteobacteria bacterium]
MAEKLRVMLVDEEAGRSAVLQQALQDNGYEVVARIGTDEDLLAKVRSIQPDMIIIDMQSPDRDTLESMQMIHREQPKPIVMFAENSDRVTIADAVKAGVSAYVVDGLNAKRIQPIMEVAIARFREFQALRDELARTRTDLAERKIIDRAKGLIMTQRKCTEDEAYKALRKLAMDRNEKLAEVARSVIEVASLFS